MRVTSAQLKYSSGFTGLVDPNPESQSHLADLVAEKRHQRTFYRTLLISPQFESIRCDHLEHLGIRCEDSVAPRCRDAVSGPAGWSG